MAKFSIGQIGLGAVGAHYADHILKAEGSIAVFDSDRLKRAYWAKRGATALDSPGAVASVSDYLLLSLPSPDAVKQVMQGQEGVLSAAKKGLLIIDCSTIDPPTCKAMYAAAKAKGMAYVEAPISGGQPGGAGTDGAKARNVTFMCGGEAGDFRRAQTILKLIGKKWHHLGPAGSGSTVKLISNHLAGLYNLCVSEAFVLGAAAGFDAKTLLKVFQDTDAKCFWMTDYFAPRLLRGDFEPGFSVDLQHKDHRLAGELASRLNVPVLFNQLALETYQMLKAQGLGGKDLVESVNFMARMANVDLKRPGESVATGPLEGDAKKTRRAARA
jgi:3-hydroxyisobutyrate dehydrogenase-like beta-hydroxyacid dehydrogenase